MQIFYFDADLFSAEILHKFIKAVESNTRDSLVSVLYMHKNYLFPCFSCWLKSNYLQVRITASWALANICESLHHLFTEVQPEYFVGEHLQFK